jgi:UDP-N-acetylglucosamine:LPS N-acetylglucosamine transferase
LLKSPENLGAMELAARELSVDDAAGRICDILLPG